MVVENIKHHNVDYITNDVHRRIISAKYHLVIKHSYVFCCLLIENGDVIDIV